MFNHIALRLKYFVFISIIVVLSYFGAQYAVIKEKVDRKIIGLLGESLVIFGILMIAIKALNFPLYTVYIAIAALCEYLFWRMRRLELI